MSESTSAARIQSLPGSSRVLDNAPLPSPPADLELTPEQSDFAPPRAWLDKLYSAQARVQVEWREAALGSPERFALARDHDYLGRMIRAMQAAILAGQGFAEIRFPMELWESDRLQVRLPDFALRWVANPARVVFSWPHESATQRRRRLSSGGRS